ncbi:MAG: hypothetical protein EBU52_01410 [Cytophagia bacterium]|nr:hypothetical protein [Cytophagia bacterium]
MIDEESKAYKLWKGFYGTSFFEEHYGTKFLYYNDSKDYRWHVDNINLKDFGEIQYLSWTEETNELTNLYILELEPHRHRRLAWTISPAKGTCLFWVNRWTDQGLFIIYKDSVTHYALRVRCSKNPKGVSLEVTELGALICVKRNWKIGYKFHTDKIVSQFDLKEFRYLEQLTIEQAYSQNIIPTEQGDNNEELE